MGLVYDTEITSENQPQPVLLLLVHNKSLQYTLPLNDLLSNILFIWVHTGACEVCTCACVYVHIWIHIHVCGDQTTSSVFLSPSLYHHHHHHQYYYFGDRLSLEFTDWIG